MYPQAEPMRMNKVVHSENMVNPSTSNGGAWSPWGALGQVGATVANNFMQQLFAERNRERNFYWNEKAANAADERQRKQFEDMYSWSAQVKELEKAGLSPSMIMGGAQGQGGATAPQGQGGLGIQAGYAPIDPMTMAQIANINADTQGKVIENENKQSVIDSELEVNAANITNLYSNAGLNEASISLTESQNAWQNIQNYIAGETSEDVITKIEFEADKMVYEADLVHTELLREQTAYEFDTATFETRVKTVEKEFIELVEKINMSRHNQSLTAEQTKNIAQLTQKYAYEMQILYSNNRLSWKQFQLEAKKLKHQFRIDWERLNIDHGTYIHNRNLGYVNTLIGGLLGAGNLATRPKPKQKYGSTQKKDLFNKDGDLVSTTVTSTSNDIR